MMRQIILDTETTGLRPEDGHRLIEIGCLEMVNRRLTGNPFHFYLNPEREVDKGAQAVHGITTQFLQDKPLFSSIADAFIQYITDAELIIHNAPFDVGFLNSELTRLKAGYQPLSAYCQITDTLAMARQIHVGQRNSLDALCKRYSVDHSKRDLHGALIDCHLLAQVYLAMTGGQESMFGESDQVSNSKGRDNTMTSSPISAHHLTVIKASADEVGLHEKYLAEITT